MWLRHALKLLLSILILSACSPSDRQQVDKLNSLSYAYHYRSIDSVESYAREARRLSAGYSDGRAEALNNLAFVSIIRMRYDEASTLLDSISGITDNQIEQLIADIQQMRLCQRRSRNREFYDFRERAMAALRRVKESLETLTDRQRQRLIYAESELAIVSSTYYYYIGLEQQSVDELLQMPDEVHQDTAQFLNYLYNMGAGGIITDGTAADIRQQEFDCLIRCFQIARQGDYPYFAANALEGLAEHLMDPDDRRQLIDDNQPALQLINPERIDEEQLSIWLADNALAIFMEYGDVYQIAGAYRTLASCYRAMGDNESALFNLEQSLGDTLILQAPDLVASIREQLSVAYAAIDDKPSSDHNRNLYLDLQEQTRQDRQLEARAAQFDRTVSQLNWILVAVVAAIILLLFLLWLFNHLNKKQRKNAVLDDLLEEKREELAMKRLHLEKAERLNLEQRAKISLVNSITPLIDRMLHEVNRLKVHEASDNLDIQGNKAEEESQKKTVDDERLEYIRELTEQIEADNTLLTQWIQLRQGELSLHIESFPLQSVFDIVARSRMSFQLKGLTLDVEPTEAVVKADRILTLFMINTLADNARKFTPTGGRVDVAAIETADYVEVSVSDTGIGMDEQQLAHVFEHKVEGGHGFGLLNCKGIIEKYRKLSQIFSVCVLQAESRKGQGSRFLFRLPKGIIRSLVIGLVCWTMGSTFVMANVQQLSADVILDHAQTYADSAYYSNVNGHYERTLLYADSCRQCLNDLYLRQRPNGQVLLEKQGEASPLPPEIQWLHDSIQTNYSLILDIRNESAVAALALHEWQLYTYNNRIYTQLFKELSADSTLPAYCRQMQQSQTDRTIAIILLVLVFIAIIPAYYFLYLRHRLYDRYMAERQQRENVESLEDDIHRTELELANLHVSNAVLDNCLSTLKHETMYYPSRIRLLVDQDDRQSLPEVIAYYRELYGLLSEQAQGQVERTKLHLTKIVPATLRLPSSAPAILGDETLLRYLFEILRRHSSQQEHGVCCQLVDEKYVEVTVRLTAPLAPIDRLLCRQILRDHGEASHRRACSIREEQINNETNMIIILPAYGKL